MTLIADKPLEDIVRDRYVATDCCAGIQIAAKYCATRGSMLLYFCLHHKKMHEESLTLDGWAIESILTDNPYEKTGHDGSVYHIPGE